MAKWDDIYCSLCETILTTGTRVHNRTGIDTIKIPSTHFQLDVGQEFPILTTKQLFIRQAVLEMLWIYQAQSNDVRWLQERNVHIWDEWEIDENGDWKDVKTGKVLRHFDPSMAYQAQSNDVRWLQERNVHIWDEWEIDENGDWKDVKTGKVLRHFDPSMAHTIGTAYGYVVKKYGLIDRLIQSLQETPEDRRRVVSLWQDAEMETAVLPSCVWSSAISSRNA